MSAARSGPLAVLIGPMAAGKSTIGRHLAELLGVPFHDLDDLVVTAAGRSIPEIFADGGEVAFRRLEEQTLREALAHGSGVLSLGGGAPMTTGVQPLLRTAPVVLLEIDRATAARRIGSGEGRPMLDGEDPLERWTRLTAQRSSTYRALARWQIDASTESVPGLARRIARLLSSDIDTPTSGKDRP
ncbi:shikimate kinase [Brachybacterium hainanense]|uniref:Shikimate kinase n=1 Tax=Brachybacterium hainanense TaxID=1541174 RepID=A0ABV6RFX9_9MICO